MEHGAELRVVPHAMAVASDVDDVTVMDESIDQRRCHHLVPEDLAPLLEAFIGRQHRRRALVAPRDDLELSRHINPAAAVGAAEFYALTDQREQSLHWMSVAIERGFTNVRWWGELDPVMARYRDDAEFQALIVRARQLRDITAARTS